MTTRIRCTTLLTLLLAGFVIPAGVARAEFEPAFGLTDSASAYYPNVATDSAGVLHFAWHAGGGIRTRARTSNGVLGAVETVAPLGAEYALAADGAGGVRFAWQSPDGAGQRIRTRRLRPDGTFGPIVDVSPAGANAVYPRLATDSAGGAAIIWRRLLVADSVIEGRRMSPAGTLGPVEALSAPGTVGDHQIASMPNGNAAVVWTRDEFGYLDAETSLWPAGGAPTGLHVLTPGGANAHDPQVALDAAGNAVFVMRHGESLLVRRLSSTGELSQAKDVRLDPAHHVAGFDLALSPAGEAQIVWAAIAGSEDLIHTRRRFSDGTFGPVQELSADAATQEPQPQVAFDAHGHAWHIWLGDKSSLEYGTKPVVMSRARTSDGTLGPLRELSLTGPGSAGFASVPSLAPSAGGRPAAAWLRTNEASEMLVHGTVLAADPVAAGGDGGGSGAPGGTGPVADVSAPVVDGLAVRPRRIRSGTRGRVRMTLSEPASVRFRLIRRGLSRRVAGSFRRPVAAGWSSVVLPARLRQRVLRAGRYRLVAVAIDAAGNASWPARARFRVLRRAR
jgi:hypothetical protein